MSDNSSYHQPVQPRVQCFSPTGMTVNGRYIPWAPKEKNDAVK